MLSSIIIAEKDSLERHANTKPSDLLPESNAKATLHREKESLNVFSNVNLGDHAVIVNKEASSSSVTDLLASSDGLFNNCVVFDPDSSSVIYMKHPILLPCMSLNKITLI